MQLTDGTRIVAKVKLNEENGWSATVGGLPAMKGGAPIQYKWIEPSVTGYTLTEMETTGQLTTITNTLWHRPELPEGEKPPKTPGETWYVFEEYDTPLGVEVMINHVGDCFD